MKNREINWNFILAVIWLIVTILAIIALFIPKKANSQENPWWVHPYEVYRWSSDNPNKDWILIMEYEIVHGDKEKYLDLWNLTNMIGKSPPQAFYSYGRVLEVDEQGRPLKQILKWEIQGFNKTMPGETVSKGLEFVKNKVNPNAFPYNFVCVIYWPSIEVYRVYVHPDFMDDLIVVSGITKFLNWYY